MILLVWARNFNFGVRNNLILGLTGNTYKVLTFMHILAMRMGFGFVGFIRIEC